MADMGNEDLPAYFHKQYEKNSLPLLRKLKLTEDTTPSSFLHLQEKRKEVEEMQNVLEAKQKEFRERMEVIKHRWREYHAKKAQLEADKQRSEEILKENSEMQIRALKKINQGREEKMHAERELLRAKELLEDLKNKHRKLSNSVQKYSIFNKYLEDVVKISEFETIEDIIGRYETLQSVRNELLQSQQKQKEKSEETKVFLDQYMKEKEAEMLQYENELVQLQQRLEKARSDALYWETRWDDIQNASLKKTQELGTIKLAILNLFQCVNTELDMHLNVPADDSHRQLDMVQQVIQDLTDIFMELEQDTDNHQ